MNIQSLITQSFREPWNAVVFCNETRCSFNSSFLVVAQDNFFYGPTGSEPTFDGNDGKWRAVCTVADVQDVLENLALQGENDQSELAKKALIFYLHHDTFMDISNDAL